MTLRGVVENFTKDPVLLAEWEQLTSDHVKSYWEMQLRPGVVIYDVKTEFIKADRRRRDSRLMLRRLGQTEATDPPPQTNNGTTVFDDDVAITTPIDDEVDDSFTSISTLLQLDSTVAFKLASLSPFAVSSERNVVCNCNRS